MKGFIECAICKRIFDVDTKNSVYEEAKKLGLSKLILIDVVVHESFVCSKCAKKLKGEEEEVYYECGIEAKKR